MKNSSPLLDSTNPNTNKKRQIVIMSIAITVSVIAILLVTLSVYFIVMAFNNDEYNVPDVGATTEITPPQNQLHNGNLLVFNAESPYKGTADIIRIENFSRPTTPAGYPLFGCTDTKNLAASKEALTALTAMLKDFLAQENNDNVYVKNAYNNSSAATQSNVYQTGNAFMLAYVVVSGTYPSIAGDPEYQWIYDNAYKYGFIVAEEEGPDVFRYIGIEHASIMQREEITTVEDYVKLLQKKHDSSKSAIKVNANGNPYAVYYVEATDKLPVPAAYAYTISGDNSSGYIVSVSFGTSDKA